jgi:hypothetical protein
MASVTFLAITSGHSLDGFGFAQYREQGDHGVLNWLSQFLCHTRDFAFGGVRLK